MDGSACTESSPLLHKPERSPNPLPWLQFSNVLIVNFCAALEQMSFLPYITQLVSELDIIQGDKRKVGHYVGLLQSLHNATSTLTVLPLSRLSDFVGRKLVMLIGMSASIISVLCFGLSRTYWALVASNCIAAFFNGNIIVVKSVIGEITDSTNRARAVSILITIWSVAGGISSVIGGGLSKPGDRFPALFGSTFWKHFPYFLPCLTVAIITTLSFVYVLFFFQETLPGRSQDREESPFLQSSNGTKPPPMWDLITSPVLISISSAALFDALFTCEDVLVPLFFAMPIEFGGLGLDPVTIGYILLGYRVCMASFMVTYCHAIIHYLGERKAFLVAIASVIVIWAVLPIANMLARSSGLTTPLWVCVGFLGVPLSLMDMGSACSLIYVNASAPSKNSLGGVNGLARVAVALGRIVAPALATSLFSLSVQYNILNGYGVFLALWILTCIVGCIVWRLPRVPHSNWEEDED